VVVRSGPRPISRAARSPTEHEAIFDLDKATFRRRDGDFETQLQVTVSPEDDVEVRRLSITNRGDRPREVEVTSYAEMVLARPEDDFVHPAFGKLFIETDYDPQSAALLFSRRPRSAGEAIWAFHYWVWRGRLSGALEWETDRARFLGRGRTSGNPVALDGRALSGTVGAVLDPIAALRERVRLPPGAFVRVTFATGVATDRAAALALARKYRDPSAASRAFSMAFTHVHITLQHLGVTDDQAILFDRLASRVFGSDASCMSPDDLAVNTLGQSNLWGYGISGDLPIVLVRVTETAAVPLARQLLQAQEYWRLKGLRADVVILNEHPAEYLDETQNFLAGLVQDPRWAGWLDKPGGMFLLRSDGMPEPDRRLLAAAARVVVRGDLGELSSQLERPAPWLFQDEDVPPTAEIRSPAPPSVPLPIPPVIMDNGVGGFAPDGREYQIVLDRDRETPLPWSNVIANEGFGTIVTASGAAFTWSENSRENRLTPFANDPIEDPTGEAIYLRDEESGAVWGATPGPLPRGAESPRWLVRHAPGITRYQHAVAGLEQELAVAVAPDDPVKVSVLTVTNTSTATRHLSVFGYVEWCLAAARRRAPVRRHGAPRNDRGHSRAQCLQHRVRRTRGVLGRERAGSIVHVRSRRVRRPQPHAEPTGRAVSRSTERAQRRRSGSVRSAPARLADRAGTVATGHLRVGRGPRSRSGNRPRDPLRFWRPRRGNARQGDAHVGKRHWHNSDQHPG
jgi:cyclic beta-1,2-glucan synthetase